MKILLIVLLLIPLFCPAVFGQSDPSYTWQAGVSKGIITPEKPMWMAGYAARTHEATETYHDLYAKVLVLEDQEKNQVVLVTADILGFPKKMSDRIRTHLQQKFGLEKSQIILNGSHTHSGPVLAEALYDIYPLDQPQRTLINDYSQWLEVKMVELVAAAMAEKTSVRLASANGVSRFQVNRRNNPEAQITKVKDLAGPNDYAVPVIKVESESGDLVAVVFGYACHPTVLDHYAWSGDYPGFAQIELEKTFPGTVAMFFQGASGDQNPMPRRTLPLAVQYGKSLAASVERVLAEKMTPLPAQVKTAYREIDLALTPAPSSNELVKMANKQNGYMQRWANRMLKESTEGKAFLENYPYPLQIWQLGGQTLFNMGGEVTIAYTIALKEKYGEDIFVMAYSNDVMGYIPSELILEEGGYEGYSSQMVYGLPSAWEKGIEAHILSSFDELAGSLGIRNSPD
ncbi:neutral/alkaline non-lysosomal ceramidase N-terminal domain-containing protein [Lunatibacter salilacus]|uniref:neutral/alkaline non-lysosomal ceramidase N-terminal domain-containing protein n=1 Tax=Lunatibacter salilacus TaxID=2483804 RepID=UPI00131C8941|nr:neutral/alkaline non-lysosomal ceramidase N-terminal domain-containing protein [Lunatibacter salilacus]